MRRFNGWQRMWIIVTIGATLWFLVVWPLRTYSDAAQSRDSYHRSMLADYASGQCQRFVDGRLEKLVEPSYQQHGGTCWFIYTTRKVQNIDDVPFALEKAERQNNMDRLRSAGDVLLVGLVGLLLVSGGPVLCRLVGRMGPARLRH